MCLRSSTLLVFCEGDILQNFIGNWLRSLQMKVYWFPSPFKAKRQDPPTLYLTPTHYTPIVLALCSASLLSFSLLLVPAHSKWMERQFYRKRTHPSLPIHLSWLQLLQVGGVGPGFLEGEPSCWVMVYLPVAPVSLYFFLYIQTGEGADAILLNWEMKCKTDVNVTLWLRLNAPKSGNSKLCFP